MRSFDLRTLVPTSDVLASFVVFLIALPLCMGIAVASGVPPAMGIVTGIIGGLVTGALAGCPLQVSGPAAGLTVIVWELVRQVGLPGLGVVVLLAGLLQIGAGRLRLGRWFQAVSPAVIHGMLAGIGVLIIASQFHVMLDDKPKGSGLQNLLSIPQAIRDAAIILDDGDFSHHAAVIGILTIVVLVAWTKVPRRVRQFLSAPLVGIASGAAVANLMGFKIQFVSVPSNLLNDATIVSLPSLSTFLAQPSTWTAALAVAFVASAETLLCAGAVDQMQKGPRSKYDKELIAQGVGNTLCGMLGALPMTGVIVRSTANIEAGGRTRASAVLHGVWLLFFVVAIPDLLRYIPISALAALLCYTGYKLVFNPGEIRKLAQYGKAELAIYGITLVAIVATDLLHGVLIGIAASALRLLAEFARLDAKLEQIGGKRWELHLHGTACFITLPHLAEVLDRVPDGAELHVHFEQLHYMDHACLELLSSWEERQEELGGGLVVEWHELEGRYRRGPTAMPARVAS